VKLEETVCLIELPSELTDHDERPYLTACTQQLLNTDYYIILDFSGVESMNGFSATMLVKFCALARRYSRHIIAFSVSEHYKDVLRITGLDGVLKVYDSREEAFAAAHVFESNIPIPQPYQGIGQDTSYWAEPVARLHVPAMPLEAINRNMNGRRVVGPVDGFGQLWQKTYTLIVEKSDLLPKDIIKALKQNFPRFQPSYNRFYPTEKGIQPGEVIAIDSSTPGGPVSTGVMVLYADEGSFTFITPQGHPESGWVTFTAFEVDNQLTIQIIGLARANDPIYEVAFRTVGSKMQATIWIHVLTSLAQYLGIPADVHYEARCVDPSMQWSQAGNVWYNAQVRTLLYMPFYWIRKATKRRSKT
jgi:anti-anti-sigma factor